MWRAAGIWFPKVGNTQRLKMICYLTYICTSFSAETHSEDKLQWAICTAERDISRNHPTTGKLERCLLHRWCLLLNSIVQKKSCTVCQLYLWQIGMTADNTQRCEYSLIWQIRHSTTKRNQERFWYISAHLSHLQHSGKPRLHCLRVNLQVIDSSAISFIQVIVFL